MQHGLESGFLKLDKNTNVCSMDDIFLADLATLLFVSVTMLPWLLESSRQIFQPMKMWAALQVVLVAPAALLVARNPSDLHHDVVIACSRGVPAALADALGVYALCNASVYLAYYAVIGRARLRKTIFVRPPRLYPTDSAGAVALLTALGLSATAAKVATAGGLSFLLENVSDRVQLQAGLGPLSYFADLAFLFALIIAIRLYALRGRRSDLALAILTFFIAAATSTLFGGRKVTLQMMMTALIVYSALRPEALRFNLKMLLALAGVYSIAIVYFFGVLFYRNANDISAVADALPQMVGLAINSFAESLMSMSYLDTYVFIVAHYDASNFYYGGTFQDLTTALLPSSWVADKPPVDDGHYVRYATLGLRLEPGTPANLLNGTASWPPETVGAAYMNWGLPAVPIGGLLLGFILAKGFQFASKRPDSVFSLVILCYLFLDFKISNLRIANFIATALVAYFIAVLVRAVPAILNLQRRKAMPARQAGTPPRQWGDAGGHV